MFSPTRSRSPWFSWAAARRCWPGPVLLVAIAPPAHAINAANPAPLASAAHKVHSLVPAIQSPAQSKSIPGYTRVSLLTNTPPEAQAQTIGVGKNVARTVKLEATDAEEDAIAGYRIVTQPSHGTLSGTAPDLTYTPASNYTGGDSFSFAASDAEGEGAPATVNITVLTDTTAPTGAFVTPTANARLSTLSGITGTATDTGTGVRVVDLWLYRNVAGVSQFWTGTAWSATATGYLPVTLGAADANGTRAWSCTAPMPQGADFPTGIYSVRSFVRDYAGQTADISRTFYSGSDTTAPVGTLEPANNTTLTTLTDGNGVSVIRGTVQDTGGDAGPGESSVNIVQLILYRDWNGVPMTWAGGSWGGTASGTNVSVGAPDANGVRTFQYIGPMPSGADLPPGHYVIRLVVIDNSNNRHDFTHTVQVLPVDITPPIATVTFPAEGANLSRLEKIAGTASDPEAGDGVPSSGLARVDVRLLRLMGTQLQHWSGTAWTGNNTVLPSRTELSWLRNTNLPGGANLPPGAYSITVNAIDRYNNSNSTLTRSFNIVANTWPAATAQSVTASGRHGQPGKAKAITLAATDAEADAIASYRIVDEPLHGTLSGTAPNLVYTADADYFGADSFTFAASDWQGEGTTAMVSLNVVEPSPVDALVKNSGGTNYIGDDIVNTDATAQTVTQEIFANGKAIYHVQVQNESAQSSLVLKVVGEAGANGWTVTYYDAVNEGLDITAAVTGANGWRPTLGETDQEFRVEVTPPANLTAPDTLDLLVSASVENAPATTDAVKAVTMAKPSGKPDIEVQRPDDHLPDQPWTGAGDGGSGYGLTTTYGVKAVYNACVTNTGAVTARYRFEASTESPGWTVVLVGDTVAEVAPGANAAIEINATPALNAALECIAKIKVIAIDAQDQPTGEEDEFSLTFKLQYLGGLMWTQDGEEWFPLAGNSLEVHQYERLGLRALKGNGGAPWPETPEMHPTWFRISPVSSQLPPMGFPGTEGWFHFKNVTASTANQIIVRCGNEQQVSVHVLPEIIEETP